MENIDNILENAIFKVNKYKNTEFYINIKKQIINYCSKNLIILKDINDIDNNIYNLYTIDPSKVSYELCNLLFKFDKYITLIINIHNKSFTIKINNEPLINIYLLFIYDNKNIYKIIKFNKHNNLFYLPPFIKCIIIYKELYNIDTFYKHNENELFKIQNEFISDIITEYKKEKIINNQNNNSIKYELIKELYHKLYKNKIKHIKLDYYYLMQIQKNNNIDFNNSLNIIIEQISDIDIIKNILIEIYTKKYQNNKFDNNDIIHIQKNNTYVIHDFRLIHYKIYLIHYNKKHNSYNHILLLNVFNSLEYEILPVIKQDDDYITHYFVIYRFIFIIILNIMLYEKTHQYKINNYIDIINEIDKFIKNNNININNYNFIGNYRDYNLDKILLNNKFKNYPYKPLIYYKQNNKLKNN